MLTADDETTPEDATTPEDTTTPLTVKDEAVRESDTEDSDPRLSDTEESDVDYDPAVSLMPGVDDSSDTEYDDWLPQNVNQR